MRLTVRKLHLYGSAAVVTILAGTLFMFFPDLRALPFIFFFGGVAISARYFGFGPGLLSTALSAAMADYYLLGGSPGWVFSRVDLERLGAYICVCLVVTSMAHRRERAERLSSEANRRFDLLADFVPVLVWMSGPDKLCNYFNHGWLQFTGRTYEQEFGYGWADGVHPDDLERCIQSYNTAFDKREPFSLEYRLRRHDGIYRTILDNGVPRFSEDGTFLGFIGGCIDIHDQKLSEESLRRTEKLAATGRLAATIAHEINNPLEAVTNLVFLARSEPSKADDFLATAEQELKRVAGITRQTLGFYRDSSSPEDVNVSSVVEDVLRLYSAKLEARGISVEKSVASDASVHAQKGDLKQVLANLLSNAIDASDSGSVIHIRAASEDSQVVIAVEDHGAGIDAQVLPHIFDAFYTTKRDIGTGLGLWVAKDLTTKNGGNLRVRTETDPTRQGTTFEVVLPARVDASRTDSEASD